MKEPPQTFWFRAKSYGWGWGLPVCWQGWLVLGGYFGLLFVGSRYFREHGIGGRLLYVLVLTLLLIAVIVAKGERPAR